LAGFKAKYLPFFAEDYRWTVQNYNNMCAKSGVLRAWWESVQPLVQTNSLGLVFETVESFITALTARTPHISDLASVSASQFVDLVLDMVFERNLAPIVTPTPPTLLPVETRMILAFRRWIVGQLAITSQFAFCPQSASFHSQIVAATLSLSSVDDIAAIRAIYTEYLEYLKSFHVISEDDFITYQVLK
jgi:hypothetical protein